MTTFPALTNQPNALTNIGASDILQVGAGISGATGTPATTGLIRAANNTTITTARNAANSANITILQTDNSNNVIIGDGTNSAAMIIYSNTLTEFIVGSTVTMSTGTTYIQSFVTNFIFNSAVTSPTIIHAAVVANGGTGQGFTLRAQDVSGTGTTTGGDLDLQSGSGGTINGNIYLRTGNTIRLTVSPTIILATLPVVLKGTNPAVTGDFRAANAFTFYARNSGNTGDNLILSQAANIVDVGGTTGSSVRIWAGSGVAINATTSSVAVGFPLVLQGANPATAGDIRAGNNTTILAARNAANNADLTIIRTDTSNNILVGQTSAVTLYLQSSSGIGFDCGATEHIMTATYFAVATGAASFTLLQADKTTNSGVGATLTVQAQNETGTSSTGGGLTLTSGTGTTVAGSLLLQTGGATKLTISPTVITLALPLTIQSPTATTSASGDLRFPKGFNLAARNQTNTGDNSVLFDDSSNGLIVGGTGYASSTLKSGTTTVTITSGLITINGALVLQGSNPAATGDIRAANNTTIIAFRNAANSGDVAILKSDNSDSAILGSGVATLYFQTASTTRLSMSSSAAILTVPLTLQGTNPATTGDIRAVNNTTILAFRNAANNADLNIIATNSGNDVSIGSNGINNLLVNAGTGNTLQLMTGAVARLTLSSTVGTFSVPVVAPGIVNTIAYIVGTGATTDSTRLLPADGYIISASIKIITPYSAGGTIAIGQSGSTSLFQATTDNNPQGTAGDVYEVVNWIQAASAAAIRTTVGGSPAAGQCWVIVRYTQPSA